MTIAPAGGTTAMDQSAEPWLPNGFPPPSFVVETERTTTTTFGARRGRWLAAAALLGAVLLIAGLLLIARSSDDKTGVATGGSTTTVADAVPTPDSSFNPTDVTPVATVPPAGPSDSTIPAAGTTVTTAAPVGPTVPPPPPGVLTPSATAVSLPTAFNPAPSTGTIALRNTGPSPLDFTAQTSTGLSAAPATGTILPGASTTVTLTLDGRGIREGDYNGSVTFGGSGGTKSVQVRSVVANAPTVQPSRPTGFVVVPPPGQDACDAKWQVEATVTDASDIKSVVAFISRGGEAPREFSMKPAPGRPRIWILVDEQDKVTPPPNLKLRVRATDALNAVGTSAEEAVTCTPP